MPIPGSNASATGSLVAFLEAARKHKLDPKDVGRMVAKMQPSEAQIQHAMAYEREHGSGGEKAQRAKLANHLQERPDYYEELERMLEVPMMKAEGQKQLKGGWERGPRGGVRKKVNGKWVYAAAGAEDNPHHPMHHDSEEAARQSAEEAGRQSAAQGEKPAEGKEAPKGAEDKGKPQEGGSAAPGGDDKPSEGGPPGNQPSKTTAETEENTTPKKLDPQKIIKQAEEVVAAVSERNPELGKKMAQLLPDIHTALHDYDQGGAHRTPDDQLTAQLKAFGRAFNQAAAPASLLGNELGGLLHEVGKESHTGKAPRQKDAGKEAAQEGSEKPAEGDGEAGGKEEAGGGKESGEEKPAEGGKEEGKGAAKEESKEGGAADTKDEDKLIDYSDEAKTKAQDEWLKTGEKIKAQREKDKANLPKDIGEAKKLLKQAKKITSVQGKAADRAERKLQRKVDNNTATQKDLQDWKAIQMDAMDAQLRQMDIREHIKGLAKKAPTEEAKKSLPLVITEKALVITLLKSGPYIGPRGGKWADAKHTIPWKESEHQRSGKIEIKPHKSLGMHPMDIHVTEKNGKVLISSSPGGHGREVPKESLKHMKNDLEGRVALPKHPSNAKINAVIDGKGKVLGKGDDGVVFKVGDDVVKMSTTIPFQPFNPHRTVAASKAQLKAQVELGNKLADKVPGIQRSKYVEHGDKGFQIKPYVEIPEKFTAEQLSQAQDTLIAMHEAGYSVNDQIQIGLEGDRVVMFDIGKAAGDASKAEKEDDWQAMKQLYRESGMPFVRKDAPAHEAAWEAFDQLASDVRKGKASKSTGRVFLRTAAKKHLGYIKTLPEAEQHDARIDLGFRLYDGAYDVLDEEAHKRVLEHEPEDVEGILSSLMKKSKLVVPLSKAGPYGQGSFGPLPTIAPVAGSAPRPTTPPIPDYQELYFQPKTDVKEQRKREAQQRRTRMQADAKRLSGVFAFHGGAEVPLEPVLSYERPGKADGEGKDRKRTAKRFTIKDRVQRDPELSERVNSDLVAEVYGRKLPVVGRNAPDDEDEEGDEDNGTGTRQRKVKKSVLTPAELILLKAKYTKRVPYTDSKGRKRYRYYYAESAIARDVKEGEQLRLGKRLVTVGKIDADGTVHLRYPDGSDHPVKGDDWAGFMTRYYGPRYSHWAAKRAEQSINAVLRLVPKEMLKDLKGDTDAQRLADLKQRAPKVYEKLSKAFNRAGVNPERAKRVVSQTLEARGWEPEARAAVLGNVLSKRTDARRVSEIIRGAENLAGGGRVKPEHVGSVTELTGGLGAGVSFEKRLESIATKAEAELAKLQAVLAGARKGGTHEKAEALAEALAMASLQKLTMLSQAFPGLADKAIAPAREALMEVPSLAPKPKTIGSEASLFVAGEGGKPKRLKARYKLMEAKDVKASHDPTKGFSKRADYPAGVQEREYHKDKAEQLKVIANAQKLEPSFVVNTNPDAVNGPPMITTDGVALGGNSRAMSMQKVYADHPEKAKELKQYLMDHAHEFGLSPQDVASMKAPMLVREVAPDEGEKHSQEEMKLLVRQMNESFTQGMDPRTMQVAMSRKLSDATMEVLADKIGDDQTLSEFLDSPSARSFIEGLQSDGILDNRTATQYFKPDSQLLNSDGKQLVERVLVGRMVGDPDILQAAQPSLVANVARAIPSMIAAEGYGKGYALGDDLAQAMSAFTRLQRRDGKLSSTMSDVELQQKFDSLDEKLIGEKHPVVDNPRGRLLLETLIRKQGPVKLAKVFKLYADKASKEPEGQTGLFGARPPLEILKETVRAAL